jgi:hypothetical protein
MVATLDGWSFSWSSLSNVNGSARSHQSDFTGSAKQTENLRLLQLHAERGWLAVRKQVRVAIAFIDSVFDLTGAYGEGMA